MRTYFPNIGKSVKQSAYNKANLNLAKARIAGVILGSTHLKEKQICENRLYRLIIPTKLVGSQGVEVINTLNFQDACFAIRFNKLHPDPETMSLIEFVNAIEKLKKLTNAKSN